MAEGQNVSFNPKEASGLVDNLRGKITGLVVNTFKSNKGDTYVNVELSVGDHTEYYLLGNTNEWAPNATKTGAISLKEGGGKVWNKSDVFKLFQSFINAGFPENLLGDDLSILVGLDVLLHRVTQDGQTRKNQNGVERPRQVLIVKTIYTPRPEMESGAYRAAGKSATGTKAAPKAAAKTTAPAATTTNTEPVDDAYVAELLIEILGEAPGKTIANKDGLKNPVFMKLTKAKKSNLRAAVQNRIQEDAFLASLVEGGLIAYSGSSIALAS